MNREQAIAIIENEKECVNRANKNDYCNRDCYNCELVKTDTEILTALDMAIKALERQSENAVSRQAAIDATWEEPSYTDPLNVLTEVRDRIKALPPAQPERKTGHWIKTARWGRVYYCDQCRNYLDFDGVNVGRGSTNYCPNCGAKMDEEGKDD